MKPIILVNVPDISPGEAFVDLDVAEGRKVEWISHSGLPSNALERFVRHPRVSRYRAAVAAVMDARRADALITHLPRMTAAVEHFARSAGQRCPHLAFSFNFTKTPIGLTYRRMQAAFSAVEQFCVFSEHEASFYPKLFQLPSDRFRPVLWTQAPPPVTNQVHVPEGPFAVAIGGEGRDFPTLLAAARATPNIRWVIIARPGPGFDQLPSNVTLYYNLPLATTWGIAMRASAVIVPLLNSETCCGHITIVSAQQLGLPVVTTRSVATREYTQDFAATTVVEPNDPEMLGQAARGMIETPSMKEYAAKADREKALKRYRRSIWSDYICDFLRRHLV